MLLDYHPASTKECDMQYSNTELLSIRKNFPCLKKIIYLDAARKAPLANSIAKALKEHIDNSLACNDTKSLHIQQLESAKASLAGYLNIDAERLNFASSTAEAFISVLLSKAHFTSKKIGVTKNLHPSVLAAIKRVAGSDGITEISQSHSILDAYGFKNLSALCSSRISSHGERFDVSHLANSLHHHGIPLILDESQSAGLYPLESTACQTAHCFALQKGFMSPPGLAGIYFSESWEYSRDLLINSDSKNQLALCALPEAVRILQTITQRKLTDHIVRLSQTFKKLLDPNEKIYTITAAPHIHLINLPYEKWHKYFIDRGIIVGESRNKLRISFGCYTSENDLLYFAKQLESGLNDGISTTR